MIVREFADRQLSLIGEFDFFNDYEDTLRYLLESGLEKEAALLRSACGLLLSKGNGYGHPDKSCIVKGCQNRSSQGRFIGDLCYPCFLYLTNGKIGPTTSFLGKIRDSLASIKEFIE